MKIESITIIFTSLGLCLIGLIIYFCCRNANNRSRTNSIESFQQLYCSSSTPSKQTYQPTIERWSSIDQPSLTFYRVYIQDKSNESYRPVTTERFHSSIQQSKAMEYVGHEVVFF